MTRHISLTNTQSGSELSSAPAPSFESLEIEGWRGRSLDDVGLHFFIFNIADDAAEYPIHSSGDT
jgi:hypothetical protein